MSSGQEESDLVAKVISSEVFQNIELHLPEITTFLERETCSSQFSSVVQILLKDGFKYFELHSIQKILLQDILITTRKIFSDCMDSIGFNLETSSGNSPTDTEFSLNQLLQVCLDILEGYTALLLEVSRLQVSVEADYLDSIPKTLISVTGDAFSHCRDSESVYGRYFSSCSSSLASLFRKSFEVQTCLLKVLDEKFIFQSQSEDDICLVLLVLEKVIEISEIVCGFELSAVVDQWKGFVKITSKYSECLRNRLDLTRAFTCLTSTLHTILTSISNQSEALEDGGNWLNRQLKLGNFVLKVVIKLCELYSGHLSQRSYQLLLQLLINLYGQDQLCENGELSRMFRSYITVGASPLLTHLLSDATFIQEWESVCSETSLKGLRSDCRLGSYSLCVHLCRKLVASNATDKQLLWMHHNLLKSVLNIIAHCSEEVKVTAEERESYSTLVASLAVLMTSLLDSDAFHRVEKHLFHSLCTGNFFVKVFIQDLLCLLARLTNESIVISWLDWLENVRKEAGIAQYDPLLVHIDCLETRLLAFLSPRARKSRECSTPLQSMSILINEPPSQPAPHHFNNLVECVERLRPEEEVCSESLLTLWRCLELARPQDASTDSVQTCSKSTMWWCRLLSSLAATTSKSLQQLQCLDSIFEVMHRLIAKSDSFVKLSIVDAVRCLFRHPISLKSESLSLLTCQILLTSVRDPEPIVKLISLEALVELNKVEFHRRNLVKILTNNKDVSTLLADYINGSSVVRYPIVSQDIFSQDVCQSDFVHKCSNVVIAFPEIESEPPAKKVKVSCREINELIAKSKLIQREMKRCLEEFGDDEGLSSSQRGLLTDLISQYETLRSFL